MSRSLIPNSTQIPDVILDHWMAHLSGAELKVVLYVARRTFGFGKESDTISINQISRGIRTRQGIQLDYGTGLSRSSVKSACASLAGRGILIKTQAMVGDTEEPDENTYRLNLYAPILIEDDSRPNDDVPDEADFEVGQKTPHVGQKSAYPQNYPKVGQKLAPQETDLQETDLQETAAEKAPTARPTRRRVAKGTAAAALTLEIPEPLTPEAEALAEALKEAGLNQADAERFARTKPAEAERQLQYLPFKANLDSPGAYLRAAIEGGFTPPKEFVQAQAKKEQERKVREEAERKKAAEALRLAQEATEAARMDEDIARLEIEAPAAFQDFEAFVAAERAKALDKPFIKPGSRTEQIMLNSFASPEKRRELFALWQNQNGETKPTSSRMATA